MICILLPNGRLWKLPKQWGSAAKLAGFEEKRPRKFEDRLKVLFKRIEMLEEANGIKFDQTNDKLFKDLFNSALVEQESIDVPSFLGEQLMNSTEKEQAMFLAFNRYASRSFTKH